MNDLSTLFGQPAPIPSSAEKTLTWLMLNRKNNGAIIFPYSHEASDGFLGMGYELLIDPPV